MVNVKAVAFDLDGTLYYNNTVIQGALEVVSYLQEKGLKIFYFTNSSVKSRAQIYGKLINMGFKLSIEHIYTSSHSAAIYLKQEGIRNAYCIGSDDLREELSQSGIIVSEDGNPVQSILIGLDYDFNYAKIAKTLDIMQKGKCLLIACNKDKSFPVEYDRLMPGCGSMVAAIEASCDTKVDYIVGKPNTFMLELLSGDWGLINNEILVVGDSYTSDIEMAKRYCCPSVLISNNNTNYKNTIVVSNIKDVTKLFA
jgi:HAD superfamily hydrolase (TIGR01450 family)